MVMRNPVLGFGADNAEDKPPVGKTQKITSYVSTGPVKIGEPAVKNIQTIHLADDGTLVEETLIMAGVCAGCGRQFKSNTDVAAMCTFCHYLVCEQCTTTYRCAKDGRQACPACGSKDEDEEFLCCKCKPLPKDSRPLWG